jgi:hypothetical protein
MEVGSSERSHFERRKARWFSLNFQGQGRGGLRSRKHKRFLRFVSDVWHGVCSCPIWSQTEARRFFENILWKTNSHSPLLEIWFKTVGVLSVNDVTQVQFHPELKFPFLYQQRLCIIQPQWVTDERHLTAKVFMLADRILLLSAFLVQCRDAKKKLDDSTERKWIGSLNLLSNSLALPSVGLRVLKQRVCMFIYKEFNQQKFVEWKPINSSFSVVAQLWPRSIAVT